MNKLDKNEDQKDNLDSKPSYSMSNSGSSTNVFRFWNGDEYAGDFAVVQGKLMMNNKGVYKTSDGHVYKGIWEMDSLKRANKITYPDKSTFSGTLDDMMMQGRGTYVFTNKLQLEGDFVDNKLNEPVFLTDSHKRLWKGKVEDESVVNFYPLHPFWQSVLSLPSKFNFDEPSYFPGEAEESETTSE